MKRPVELIWPDFVVLTLLVDPMRGMCEVVHYQCPGPE